MAAVNPSEVPSYQAPVKKVGGEGTSASILVVDDEPGMRNFLERALKKMGAYVEVADSVEQAQALRDRCYFDLMIMDIRMPGESGVEWVTSLREQGCNTDVIFMTAYAELDMAIQALRTGAMDFIIKPFRLEQMLTSVERCLERQQLKRENFLLRRELDKHLQMDGMVGHSPAVQEVCGIIKRVAPTPSTILIEGESGTGKELAARAIHQRSGRKGEFAPINCGSISPELLESELFGHSKGAFTGAHKSRQGLFNYANGGTVFLDEIGEMPLPMQAKLLRVLEERAIRPIGTEQEVPVDVRIIAATNRDLSEEVKLGKFREDLYYRLNVLSIRMPALRERVEDIPDLAEYFSNILSEELGVEPIPFNHDDLIRLQSYTWPGNIREFKNIIERSLLLGQFPGDCLQGSQHAAIQEQGVSQGYPAGWTMDNVEKAHMQKVLQEVNGNKSEAARRLGVSRKTMERKTAQWQEA
ncbi:MAG: sigma-54-dependent Fis family transcriptional regulator [Gammaproteobacteria bacterium]|nr:sigma-54-dependent Fis family transcriptional regulator [Gammaproteobacteria bacterium]